MKRANRRHHEARVKNKFRKVAEHLAGPLGSWLRPTRRQWGPAARTAYIERTANRLAHHNKCPCQLCKRERYDRTEAKRLAKKLRGED